MIRPFALVITGLRSGRLVSTTSAVLWERSCDEQTTSAACQDTPHSSEAGPDDGAGLEAQLLGNFSGAAMDPRMCSARQTRRR
jgi:hypothetical protein